MLYAQVAMSLFWYQAAYFWSVVRINYGLRLKLELIHGQN